MRFTLMLIVVVVSVATLPAVTSAREVEFPDGAIGISEATFAAVREAHCYVDLEGTGQDIPEDSVLSADGSTYCDPVLAPLVNQVFFRAEHYGEMYTFIAGDGYGGLRRYLPDGMYKVNGKLFWVANSGTLSFRTRLPQGDRYRRVLLTAQRTNLVTYLALDDLSNPKQAELRGRVVVLTDQGGMLAYVPGFAAGSDAIGLTENNSAAWHQSGFFGEDYDNRDEVITNVDFKTLKKLAINNDWKD